MKEKTQRQNSRANGGSVQRLVRAKTKAETDIWKDPRVKAALKSGRPADDSVVLSCPKCGLWGYYDQGSHFTCLHCDENWYCCSEDEAPPTDRQYLWLDGFTTLADTVSVEDVP